MVRKSWCMLGTSVLDHCTVHATRVQRYLGMNCRMAGCRAKGRRNWTVREEGHALAFRCKRILFSRILKICENLQWIFYFPVGYQHSLHCNGNKPNSSSCLPPPTLLCCLGHGNRQRQHFSHSPAEAVLQHENMHLVHSWEIISMKYSDSTGIHLFFLLFFFIEQKSCLQHSNPQNHQHKSMEQVVLTKSVLVI